MTNDTNFDALFPPPRGQRVFYVTPVIKSFTGTSMQDLDTQINAFLASLATPVDKELGYTFLTVFHQVTPCPQPLPPPIPQPRLLNVIASDQSVKTGDFLPFGAASQSADARYVAPFDYTLDIGSFGHTAGSTGELIIRVNGNAEAILNITAADDVFNGIGISGDAGDAIQVEVTVDGNPAQTIEDPVLSMVLQEKITPPPPPPIDPCPAIYTAMMYYNHWTAV